MHIDNGTMIYTPRETLAGYKREQAAQERLVLLSKTAKHRAHHTALACEWAVMAAKYALAHNL